MLDKKFYQILSTYFFLFMLSKIFVYVLDFFEFNNPAHKNNPHTNSPQQNKKAVLKAAAYFKVSNLVRSQSQKSRLLVIKS